MICLEQKLGYHLCYHLYQCQDYVGLYLNLTLNLTFSSEAPSVCGYITYRSRSVIKLLKKFKSLFKNQSIVWLIMNLASLLLSAREVIRVSVNTGF